MIAEVFPDRPFGLAVLFSGLFYVAASRVNSPRLSVVLIRRGDFGVKAHRSSLRPKFVRASLRGRPIVIIIRVRMNNDDGAPTEGRPYKS